MVNLGALRTQHDSALAMAERLLELASDPDPRSAAIPILMQLNRLLGLLRVHFVHEDVELYPALMGSGDPQVARTVRRHVDEMGGLAIEFEGFARRWSCSAGIAGNIDEFREGAHALMLDLAVRIEREEHYLYPLVGASSAQQRDAA